ncbi:glutaredoxin domain-containing cysteine-rich protein 1 [Menidia menidia]
MEDGKTVRFRVASAHSGRVLAEVFKDQRAWDVSAPGSRGSGGGEQEEEERDESPGSPPPTPSEANRHLDGLRGGGEGLEETDDLLLYASRKREKLFSNKRINIFSQNGTVRGVRNKVGAGQVLFNSLSSVYSGSHRRRRPWEKE